MELQDQLDQAMRAPSSYGVFAAAHHEEREADVYVAGRKMRLPVAATLRSARCVPGQEVRLNEQFLVVAASGFEANGEVGVVREVLDGDRVLVALRADDERVLRLAGPLLGRRYGWATPSSSTSAPASPPSSCSAPRSRT